jgi:penicillin-binding protein 1C
MDLIYPKPNSKIFIPRELNGVQGNVVFELAHRNPHTIVYWHLDGDYLGSTKGSHHLPLNPGEGEHFLTVVDEAGESLDYSFVVISNM